MKLIGKGELKSVLQEYHMLLNYIERHEEIYEKAFAGISDSNRLELQEKLKNAAKSLKELKEFCGDVLNNDYVQ